MAIMGVLRRGAVRGQPGLGRAPGGTVPRGLALVGVVFVMLAALSLA